MPTINLTYTEPEHAELETEAKRQGKTLYQFVWSTPLLVARAQAELTKMESIKRSSISGRATAQSSRVRTSD